MRIDSLKTTPDRAGRYLASFSDGSSARLYRQTVEDHGLYVGKELTQEEYTRLLTDAGQMSAKMRAVRIVSASNVSKRDLESRLIRKGEDPDQAKNAVAWMEELHLLDDRQTAQSVVRSCVSRGYGVQRAKQALYEKRVPRVYWEEALADYPDQAEHIEAFLSARLDEHSEPKDVRKAVDALLRRGHGYSTIRRVLNSLCLDGDGFPEE